MPWGTAHFPDAAVGLAPNVVNDLSEPCQHACARLINHAASSGIAVGCQDDLAVNVSLLLTMSAVADTDRARLSIAGEMCQLPLVKISTTVDVVHYI